MRGALGRAGSLLEATSRWVRVREASHYLFTAASAAALLVAWLRSGRPIDEVLTFGGAVSAAKAALTEPLLLVVCAVFYALGWWCTRQAYGCYSRFWYGLRPRLRVDEPKRSSAVAPGA